MRSSTLHRLVLIASAFIIGAVAPAGFAREQDLAGYFGFSDLEVVKIGDRAGPLIEANLDRDDLTDLIVVNNRDSRIELLYQKPGARPDDVMDAPVRVNEFPEHWRFRREFVSVTHRVMALVAHDFDGDGLTDLIYAGLPAEIVFVRQTAPGVFEVSRRHRVKNLAATRDGLAVADFLGSSNEELLALVDGGIRIWSLEDDRLAEAVDYATGEKIVAFVIDDLNGDGRADLTGIIPEDPAPVRIWFGGLEDGRGVLGAQTRHEMPPLIECASVRLPGVPAALLAVIERASKRIVVYEVIRKQVEMSGDRDVAIDVHSFTDAGNRKRAHVVVDLDGDGRLDLVATDTEANAIVTYRQRAERGLEAAEMHPSLSKLTYLVAGNVDGDPEAELFALSEAEGVVGRCDVETRPDGRLHVPFPRPVTVSSGHTPTALNLVELEDGPRLAVVAKDGRDYVVDLIDMDGASRTISLGKMSRSPETIVAVDADQNGRTDLLLFTREKPMTMLAALENGEDGEDGFSLIESKDMGQFGLVKAAKAENIAVFDIDGDGNDELLIADQNYVRAVRYDLEPDAGVSPGWQVVTQINARESASKLVSLAVLSDRVVAADRENDRLVVMALTARSTERGGTWNQVESLSVRGFSFGAIEAGEFAGDGRQSILAIGEDGFAVLRLAGDRVTLRETAAWRAREERRREHELAAGDVNGDGFTDLVALDAGEQMCEIFTFTESGRMLYASGFKVFESQLFTGGEAREFEPSQAIITDVTGDGAADLVLLAHDRVLLYPQMTTEGTTNRSRSDPREAEAPAPTKPDATKGLD